MHTIGQLNTQINRLFAHTFLPHKLCVTQSKPTTNVYLRSLHFDYLQINTLLKQNMLLFIAKCIEHVTRDSRRRRTQKKIVQCSNSFMWLGTICESELGKGIFRIVWRNKMVRRRPKTNVKNLWPFRQIKHSFYANRKMLVKMRLFGRRRNIQIHGHKICTSGGIRSVSFETNSKSESQKFIRFYTYFPQLQHFCDKTAWIIWNDQRHNANEKGKHTQHDKPTFCTGQ